MGKSFGIELILDLHDCDPKVIRSRQKLREYAMRLCRLLKMKRYGKTLTPHFGHDNPLTSGYSLLQFIETSSITGHFSELTNTAYLNIFSCKEFDAQRAREFTRKFFKAKSLHNRVIVRK
ncbi:MAG: S-adenosylmethionine decarboxylase [Candidatus Omnitrophica bacterium]|nr:S-adenosylmethionine decarboxylase [Candidatus Omnitrophota bacterium]